MPTPGEEQVPEKVEEPIQAPEPVFEQPPPVQEFVPKQAPEPI
jgi:hypothetical protein